MPLRTWEVQPEAAQSRHDISLNSCFIFKIHITFASFPEMIPRRFHHKNTLKYILQKKINNTGR